MDAVLATLDDPQRIRELVEALGPWGPLAIVLALAGAIIVSPIPSAPIALAAGALYGGVWGTVYVVTGAELGALAAFIIARRFGYAPVRRVPWIARWLDRTRSQAMLAGLVFASRLLPFLSFDLVSYAAGLTPLRLRWFALATLAGVVPVSALLVWSGERMAAQGAAWIGTAVLLAGGITLLPLLWRRLRRG
ncbi:MAG TPA: VTT domain-containing protein [Falsiroseomonas sp.]|nr:VTT domain-containing protein [Falsiroseomonas sp.]